MQQGLRFSASTLDRMMSTAASDGNVQLMEDYLRLGGIWYPNYVHRVFSRNHLTFCRWVQNRGLDLDLPHLYLPNIYPKDILAWLASLEVYMVPDENLLSKYPGSHEYIIAHYPRYVNHPSKH